MNHHGFENLTHFGSEDFWHNCT